MYYWDDLINLKRSFRFANRRPSRFLCSWQGPRLVARQLADPHVGLADTGGREAVCPRGGLVGVMGANDCSDSDAVGKSPEIVTAAGLPLAGLAVVKTTRTASATTLPFAWSLRTTVSLPSVPTSNVPRDSHQKLSERVVIRGYPLALGDGRDSRAADLVSRVTRVLAVGLPGDEHV